MNALLILIFLVIALAAAAFVVWPILHGEGESLRARAVLAAAAVFLVVGVGGGTYLMLGSPGLAVRSLTGPRDTDLPGLIAELVSKVRANPRDLEAWTLLGRGYLTLGDPGDASGAFKQAIALAPASQQSDLLASYGEALTMANSGAVPPEAEAAFQTVLAADPRNDAARYYIGLAYAGRRQTGKAMAMWQGLLADAPVNAPWRGMLLDKIAALKAGDMAAGGGPPDIGAMVAQLAARLKTQPNDPEGWQRLIRAYSVLGDTAKAGAALADARMALKGDSAALSAIDAEARSLNVTAGSAAPEAAAIGDTAATGVAPNDVPPEVLAMVARLAARLKTAPNDPVGWQRLIRSYSVLGETAKAGAAVADARAALKGNDAALAAVDAEARSLNLQQ